MQNSYSSKIKSITRMPFVKMHGLGNDFVIIDKNDFDNYLDNILTQNKGNLKQAIIKILDRRIGIGADQLIIYKIVNDHNVEMEIHNSDGSIANACGNASRCILRLLADQRQMSQFLLHAGGREASCSAINGKYAINMGEVTFTADWMPRLSSLRDITEKYNMQPKDLICADIGNKHLVIFSTLSQKDKEVIGRDMQNSELFPGGVNVNFVEINKDKIKLQVYERGTGFTLACGSGACASFASAYKLGYVSNEANISFELGQLHMVLNEYNQVIMEGQAEYSFIGEFY